MLDLVSSFLHAAALVCFNVLSESYLHTNFLPGAMRFLPPVPSMRMHPLILSFFFIPENFKPVYNMPILIPFAFQFPPYVSLFISLSVLHDNLKIVVG